MGEAAKEIRQLGRYSLLTKIASGGMGEVHLARLDSVQGVEKLFAIKLLLPQFAEEQSVVDMFVTEARIAARIAHTNVCQVFELGLEGDELFICMEYLRGIPATTILKTHKPLNPVSHRISIAIVKQAAAGLQFAHDLRDEEGESLGVVHRDISPGNIFVTAGGTAKVLDFGVVKAKDSSHKTKTGALKGKFGYMSPEQIMAEPLDSRSDIFSLGIVLFELLTNRRLFTRDSEYGTLKAITESPIPTLASFRPDLPDELDAVLARALSRDREERYQSMEEFASDLAQLDLVDPKSTSSRITAARWRKRQRTRSKRSYAFWLGAVVVVASVSAMAVVLLMDGEAKKRAAQAPPVAAVAKADAAPVVPPTDAKPAFTQAHITLVSTPTGAAVYQGALEVCATTPCVFSPPKTGDQIELRIVHDGFEDGLVTITPELDDGQTRPARLTKLPTVPAPRKTKRRPKRGPKNNSNPEKADPSPNGGRDTIANPHQTP